MKHLILVALLCAGVTILILIFKPAEADHNYAHWASTERPVKISVYVDEQFVGVTTAISGWNASQRVRVAVAGTIDCDEERPTRWGAIEICPLSESSFFRALATGASLCQQQSAFGEEQTPDCRDYQAYGLVRVKLSEYNGYYGRGLLCHEFGHTLPLHHYHAYASDGRHTGCMWDYHNRCPSRSDLDHLDAEYGGADTFSTVEPALPATYSVPADCPQPIPLWWRYACVVFREHPFIDAKCKDYGL